MVHQLLLLVFDENAFVDSQNKSRSEILAVIVVLRISMLWRERFSLKLGTELHSDIVFGAVSFESLDVEDMIFAIIFAPPFSLSFLQLHAKYM